MTGQSYDDGGDASVIRLDFLAPVSAVGDWTTLPSLAALGVGRGR